MLLQAKEIIDTYRLCTNPDAFLSAIERIGFMEPSIDGMRMDPIYAAAQELRENRRDLKEAAKDVRKKAERIEEQIDGRMDPTLVSVNSLGELQGMGSALDIACALHARARGVFTGIVMERIRDKAQDDFKVRLEKLEKITPGVQAIVNILRTMGQRTIKQIGKERHLSDEQVFKLLLLLVTMGFVRQVKNTNYYGFDGDSIQIPNSIQHAVELEDQLLQKEMMQQEASNL